mmetsp:Transcript_1199/g.3708  ORF Transcript_1199/g.3708 Transcript_1199/m.3708 type:complete len:107 (-) Transcript_1199:150-470(-)
MQPHKLPALKGTMVVRLPAPQSSGKLCSHISRPPLCRSTERFLLLQSFGRNSRRDFKPPATGPVQTSWLTKGRREQRCSILLADCVSASAASSAQLVLVIHGVELS